MYIKRKKNVTYTLTRTKWKSLSSSTNQPMTFEELVNPRAKMRATLAAVEKMTQPNPNTRKKLMEVKDIATDVAKRTHTA